MQSEIFFTTENSQLLTPDSLALFFTQCGVRMHVKIENGDYLLMFDEEGGAYIELGTNEKGEATYAEIYLKFWMRNEGFRLLLTAFEELGWTYCDESYY